MLKSHKIVPVFHLLLDNNFKGFGPFEYFPRYTDTHSF